MITYEKFTVRVGLRPDNPAFPVYLVFIGTNLIGKSFSLPDLECCRWLERQHAADRVVYAESSATLKSYSTRRRGKAPA